ncbi:MAG: class I SAM-dependent methyltransferase [Promethearchaeota archaeon]
MPVDYKIAIDKLRHILSFVNSVAVIERRSDLVYSTNNWEIKGDINNINSIWSSNNLQTITISGIQYLIRTCSNDRLIASSLKGEGHIVGVKDDERTIIALIEPDGIIPFTTVEISKVLASLKIRKPYLDENTELGKKAQLMKTAISSNEKSKIKEINNQNEQKVSIKDPILNLLFTARLIAFYRAKEKKRDQPLIVDPFAERLAGDMSSYIDQHIRLSEMDYPIVRSYYIEEKLLSHWCTTYKKSQIVLLGAGFDTRAYRFKPLQKNIHRIFEIDFPNVIHYKEEVLRNEKSFCDILRLSTDLSDPKWSSQLIKIGFSEEIPTFWVLEGFAYYIEKEIFLSILTKAAEISQKYSQIFVDIMHLSRWFSFPYSPNGIVSGPFSRHFKWGLDIRAVPSFFARAGWRVSCSFADEHDQGRNVGQKGMIFIHGEKVSILEGK